MTIFNKIKEKVNELVYLNEEEKINLPFVIMYYIAKNAPYFENRYEILRLAEVSDVDFQNTISFGHMELNEIKMYTNNRSNSFIFKDDWGESDRKFMLTNKDIQLLKSAQKLLNESNNIDELIKKTEMVLEINNEFLHHYNYIMREKIDLLGYNEKDIFNIIKEYLDDNWYDNHDIEKKYNTRIYKKSYQDIKEIDNNYNIKEILRDKNKIKSSIENYIKENNININNLTLEEKKKPEIIIYKNRKKELSEIKKILYDQLIFKKKKFESKMLIKNKLESQNENQLINKYKKEIINIYNELKKENPILENNISKYKTKLHSKEKNQNFNLKKELPKENWYIANWDKDKGIGGFEYSKQEYIENEVEYSSKFISISNELETVSFIKFYPNENNLLKLSVLDCIKEDPEIVVLAFKEIKKYAKRNKIKLILIDFINNHDNGYNFRKKPFLDLIKKDKSDIIFCECGAGLNSYESNRLFFEKFPELDNIEYSMKKIDDLFDREKRIEIKKEYNRIMELEKNVAKKEKNTLKRKKRRFF